MNNGGVNDQIEKNLQKENKDNYPLNALKVTLPHPRNTNIEKNFT